jgi:hypothetical protein
VIQTQRDAVSIMKLLVVGLTQLARSFFVDGCPLDRLQPASVRQAGACSTRLCSLELRRP